MISGILPLLNPGGGSSTTTASSGNTFGEANTVHPAATTPGVRQPNGVLPATTSPTVTSHSLSPTGTGTTNSNPHPLANPGESSNFLPSIDLSQPVVRLEIGVLVLAVSIIILILTRRRRVAVH
jgi:hypothetical protein